MRNAVLCVLLLSLGLARAGTPTDLNVLDYGLVCDDSTDDRAALNTLVNTTIASTGGTIYIPTGVCRLASSVAIPVNVTVRFANGGSLRPANSTTLTINGTIDAGPTNIFKNATAGLGTVALGTQATRRVLPEWWGAVGDDSTASSAAFQAAEVALGGMGGKGTIKLSSGTYSLGTTGVVTGGSINWIGNGRDDTKIRYIGSGTALQVNDGTGGGGTETHGWTLRDFTIDGRTTGGTETGVIGLGLGAPSGSPLAAIGEVQGVTARGFTTAGIKCIAVQGVTFLDVYSRYNTGDGLLVDAPANNNTLGSFYGCRFIFNTGKGARIKQAIHFTFDNCDFESNGQEGMYVERPDDANVAINNLDLDRCYFEQNNTAQTATFYQLYIDAISVSRPVTDASVRWPIFISPNTGNKHLWIGAATADIWYPYFQGASGTSAATRSSSSASIAVWDRDAPSTAWTFGSASVVLYHQLSGGDDAIYANASGTAKLIQKVGTNGIVPGSTTVSTATYTVLPTDAVLSVTYTATGAVTVTMPLAASFCGRQLVVKDMAGKANLHAITVARAGSNTINGSTSLVMAGAYASTRFISDCISKWGTF